MPARSNMSRHWDTLLEETRGQYTVIVDKTWEDIHPEMCFDESVTDIEEICRKIDRCELDWFMLRARVFYEGVELADDIVGGFLYEDAREVLRDGVAEDLIETALEGAKKQALEMKRKFQELEI